MSFDGQILSCFREGWARPGARIKALLLSCLLAPALLIPGPPLQAAPAVQTFTEKDSGQTVTLRVGDKLRLDLRNPGSGGYTVLPPIFDAQVLTLLSRQDRRPEPSPIPRAGDFGRVEFTWEARQPGESEVTVNVARPWEKDKPPEQFMKIRVIVGS